MTSPSFPRLATLAVAALALLAGSARADDPPMGAPPPPPPPGQVPAHGRFFDTYDTNSDGKITREEYMAGPGAEADLFDLYDKDKDGVITPEELGLPPDFKTDRNRAKEHDDPLPDARAAGAAERREKFLKQIQEMDVNKDGKVTREEWKGKPATFDLLDKNHDGVLSAEDARMPGGPGGPGLLGGGMPPTPEMLEARFKEQDKNGDGKISPDEFPGAPERFKMLDKDGDGFLSLEEFRAGAKGRGGGRIGENRLAQLDTDKDGKVSRAEFPGSDEMFKRLDKNGDGFITPDEVEGDRREGKGKRPGGEAGTPPPPPGGAPPMGAPTGGDAPGMPGGGDMGGGGQARPSGGLGSLFAILDRNKDGKLSREEFPGTDDEWRALDRDHNGWITPEEANAPAPAK